MHIGFLSNFKEEFSDLSTVQRCFPFTSDTYKYTLNSLELRFDYFFYVEIGVRQGFIEFKINNLSINDNNLRHFSKNSIYVCGLVEKNGKTMIMYTTSSHTYRDMFICTSPMVDFHKNLNYKQYFKYKVGALKYFLFCHAYKYENNEYPKDSEYSHGSKGIMEFKDDLPQIMNDIYNCREI